MEILFKIHVILLIIIQFSRVEGDLPPHAEANCPVQYELFDYSGESKTFESEEPPGWDMYFIMQGKDLPLTTSLYCDAPPTFHTSVNKTLVPKEFKNVVDCTSSTTTKFHVIAPGTQYTDLELFKSCTIIIDCSTAFPAKRAWVSITQHMTSLGSNSLFLNIRPELIKKQISEGLKTIGICLRTLSLAERTESESVIERTKAKTTIGDRDEAFSYTSKNPMKDTLDLILLIAAMLGGYVFTKYIVRIIVTGYLDETATLLPNMIDAGIVTLEHVLIDCATAIQGVSVSTPPLQDNWSEQFDGFVWNNLHSSEKFWAAPAQRDAVQRSGPLDVRQVHKQREELDKSLGLLSPIQSQSETDKEVSYGGRCGRQKEEDIQGCMER